MAEIRILSQEEWVTAATAATKDPDSNHEFEYQRPAFMAERTEDCRLKVAGDGRRQSQAKE